MKVSDISKYVGKSRRCCVCAILFSIRTRLIAHLSDKRLRGSRVYNCRSVILSSGFIAPVNDHEYQDAHLQDRESRNMALKHGHSQPLSTFCVKRAKVGMTMAQCMKRCTDNNDEVPSNFLDWSLVHVPPKKRVRYKSSPDSVMAQWVQTETR